MGKKIADYKLVDYGMEHAQYHQGLGVYGTEFDSAFVGVGATPKEAFEDVLSQLSEDGYDIPKTLEDEGSNFDEDNYVGYKVSISISPDKEPTLDVEAAMVSAQEIEHDVDDGVINIEGYSGNVEDFLGELYSGIDVSDEDKEILNKKAAQIDSESEHYYYVHLRVKDEDSAEESVEEAEKYVDPTARGAFTSGGREVIQPMKNGISLVAQGDFFYVDLDPSFAKKNILKGSYLFNTEKEAREFYQMLQDKYGKDFVEESKLQEAFKISDFLSDYLETALWSSVDDGGKPLDSKYDFSDIAEESLKKSDEELWHFYNRASEKFGDEMDEISYEQFAHDFWLTRNGHGVGFWDRGYDDELGDGLTDMAKEYGEVDVIVGDDGKLYFEGGKIPKKLANESKLQERSGLGFIERFPELETQLYNAIEDAGKDVETAYDLFTAKVEEVEHESRDGFSSSNDGGYTFQGFATLSYLEGSGSYTFMPPKALDAISDLISESHNDAIESFKEKYAKELEGIPEDKINYNDLYDMGEERLANELEEIEQSYLDETVMFEISAFMYDDGNHGIGWTVQGAINWESPYHRSKSQFEDYKKIEVDFDNEEDMRKNFNKVLNAVKECKKYILGSKRFGGDTNESKKFGDKARSNLTKDQVDSIRANWSGAKGKTFDDMKKLYKDSASKNDFNKMKSLERSAAVAFDKSREEIEEAKKFDDDDVMRYLEQWRDSENFTDYNLALDKMLDIYAIYLLDSGGALSPETSDNPEMEKYLLGTLKKAGKRGVDNQWKELMKNVEVWINSKTNKHAFIPQIDVDYFVSKSDLESWGYKFDVGYDKNGKKYEESVLDESIKSEAKGDSLDMVLDRMKEAVKLYKEKSHASVADTSIIDSFINGTEDIERHPQLKASFEKIVQNMGVKKDDVKKDWMGHEDDMGDMDYYYNPKTDEDFIKIARDVYGSGVRDNSRSELIAIGKEYHEHGDENMNEAKGKLDVDKEANKLLKTFLKKYDAEDVIKSYEDDPHPDYGDVKDDNIKDVDYVFGNRELSAYAPNGYLYHWFVDSYGDKHSFVLSSVTDENGKEIEEGKNIGETSGYESYREENMAMQILDFLGFDIKKKIFKTSFGEKELTGVLEIIQNTIKKGASDEEIGNNLIAVLNLKTKDGRVNTEWGTKTPTGLSQSIKRIIGNNLKEAEEGTDMNESEDKFKKLDDLQMKVRELMDKGDDASFKKAQELQKEVTKLMDELYTTKKMGEASQIKEGFDFESDKEEIIADLIKEKDFAEFGEEIAETFEVVDDRFGQGEEVVKFEADGTEYWLLKNDEQAHDLAIKYVTSMLEDEPELFNKDFLQNHIYITDTDRRIIAGEEADSRLEDLRYNMERSNVDGDGYKGVFEDTTFETDYETLVDKWLEQEVGSDEEEAVVKEIENLAQKALDEKESELYDQVYKDLEDPIQYFVHDLGAYSVEDLMKSNFIRIDVESAAKEAVDIDSPEHFLSMYDGRFYYTSKGYIYYRE